LAGQTNSTLKIIDLSVAEAGRYNLVVTLGGRFLEQFVDRFARIDRLDCAASADNWLQEYDLKKENAFYVDHVRFVRLIPQPMANTR
jgi:hypothetical protein